MTIDEVINSKYLRIIAAQLAEAFGNPCNYSPLTELMSDYCEDRCIIDNDVNCWVKLLQKWVKEYV